MNYEIRALSFSEILDTSFSILRENFVLLVGVSASMYLPIAIVSAFLGQPVAEAQPELDVQDLLAGLFILVYLSVLWPIVTASLAHAIGEIYRGNQVTIGAALSRGWKLILPLSGTAILAWTLTLFGLILLVIPGIYLMLAWSQWTNIAVLEDTFGYKALKRSSELVRGYRWRTFGLFFVIGIVVWVLSVAVSLTLGFVPLVGPLVEGVVQSIGGTFTSIILVVMYFDLRCRKEQFDIEHLATIVSSPAAESAAALS